MASTNLMADRKREMMLAAAQRWSARGETRQAALAALAQFGPGSADSPMKRAHYQARQDLLAQAADLRAAGQLPRVLERKIGATLDFLSQAPSEAARTAGRPVARIVTSVDPQIEAEGFATGFLIHPGLLLTNWHVFPDAASASGCGLNFLHEEGERGLQVGITFATDADGFFVSNEELDFAVIGVAPTAVTGESLADLGVITPSEATSKILTGQAIDIIQYPDGGAKQYATRNNRLVDILDEGFLHYETDTLEGSSGSPAFSAAWEIVALHHAGIPEVVNGQIMTVDGKPWSEDMGDDQVKWIANEGIRISAIVKALAKVELKDPSQSARLRELLQSTTDPADEISRILTGTAPAEPGEAGAPQRLAVAGATFNFTGPVTINVGAAGLPAGLVPDTQAALEKSLRFDPDYASRKGYQPDFLGSGIAVPVPAVAPERDAEMYKVDGKIQVLPYHHYSLAMNARRRLQMWSAVNVDFDPTLRGGSRTGFGTDRWIGDPRIPAQVQMEEPMIYGPARQIDRGHIVRREDSAWGATPQDYEYSNSDTFHWTNCTPQHAAFNRASPPSTRYGKRTGLWGAFESYVQASLQKDGTKACILAGPILAEDDPVAEYGHFSVQYPIRFWKIVAVPVKAEGDRLVLQTFGFVMSQKDVVDKFGIEFAPGQYERYRTPLAEIASAAGLVFDPVLIEAEHKPAA